MQRQRTRIITKGRWLMSNKKVKICPKCGGIDQRICKSPEFKYVCNKCGTLFQPKTQYDIFDKQAGQVLADVGIAEAAAGSESEHPDWQQQALEFFRIFNDSDDLFMTEDVRFWAEAEGLETPLCKQSWGNVTRAARKKGWIIPAAPGHSKNPKCHSGLQNRWRRPAGYWNTEQV